jgi:hypothetical protein
MTCPTCDHKLATLVDETHKVLLCRRCGTTVVIHFTTPDEPVVHVPDLVERCRRFESDSPVMVNIAGKTFDYWCKAGISEAINVPSARPQ